MPRSCSSAIQSEVAWREVLRDLTEPAIWIAPPNSSSFSVRVVLPASGCEMIAKVRRRAASAATSGMAKAPAGATGMRGGCGLYGLWNQSPSPAKRERGWGEGVPGCREKPDPHPALRASLSRCAGEGLKAGSVVWRRLAEAQDAAVAEHPERDRFQVHAAVDLDPEVQVRPAAGAAVAGPADRPAAPDRSEERRVGQEGVR